MINDGKEWSNDAWIVGSKSAYAGVVFDQPMEVYALTSTRTQSPSFARVAARTLSRPLNPCVRVTRRPLAPSCAGTASAYPGARIKTTPATGLAIGSEARTRSRRARPATSGRSRRSTPMSRACAPSDPSLEGMPGSFTSRSASLSSETSLCSTSKIRMPEPRLTSFDSLASCRRHRRRHRRRRRRRRRRPHRHHRRRLHRRHRHRPCPWPMKSPS